MFGAGGLGSIGRLQSNPSAVHFVWDSIARSTFGLGFNVAVLLSGLSVSSRSVYSGLEILLDGAVGKSIRSLAAPVGSPPLLTTGIRVLECVLSPLP